MNFNSPDRDQFMEDSKVDWRLIINKCLGRPALERLDRDTVINGDDITNLKIALGTADSLESFLEMV